MKFYLAEDPTGRVIVVTRRPAKPAAVHFRTREHAEAIAARLNEEPLEAAGEEQS